MSNKRFIPAWPFPSYIFIPGENAHPKKSGGHMEGLGDPVATPIDAGHPEANEFLRFSLDLYNHGYFWESHVYFEAIWNAHGRQGSVADFMKGMIKLGAAGVKIKINQQASAVDHFLRAKELFASVMASEGPDYLGFDLKKILKDIDQAMESQEMQLKVFPSWT
jgi:predicted metal-dependent hydrolase